MHGQAARFSFRFTHSLILHANGKCGRRLYNICHPFSFMPPVEPSKCAKCLMRAGEGEHHLCMPEAKRIVVKIGTDVLVKPTGELDHHRIGDLVEQLAKLRKEGKEIIVVTSGAIGAGKDKARQHGIRPPVGISEMAKDKFYASLGQPRLMDYYSQFFSGHHVAVAQLLPSRKDLQKKEVVKMFAESINNAVDAGVIPILNENDPLSHAEIEPLEKKSPRKTGRIVFGDNDVLAASVASIGQADLLVLLTDVEGIYDKDPNKHPDAKLLRTLQGIPPELRAKAAEATGGGRGGTRTKFHAADIANLSGIPVVIAHGGKKNVLLDIVRGEKGHGTIICPPTAGRTGWLKLVSKLGKLFTGSA